MGPKATTATMISAMRYDDPAAAVDWLCRVFGFKPHAVYKDDAGNVVHAELSFGNGMIMLGPNIDSPFGRYMTMPKDAGGRCTQTVYVIVDDVDAHHAHASAAGADVIMPLRDESYGGREYSCRDPEGHVWTFGNYDPWTHASNTAAA
nr:MAG: glyoxalase [Pseudomonadota bacterium]